MRNKGLVCGLVSVLAAAVGHAGPVDLRQPLIQPGSGTLMVTIDLPGNPPDTTGRGSVGSSYRIGVFEVTNTQYVQLLNAIAASDPNGLFHPEMTDSDRGGILRAGSPGSHTYSVKPNFEQKPVNWLSWTDSARYCNWLHNGTPVGVQGPATTEDGAYDLSLPPGDVSRKPGARFFLPSHDEWYKAAYYDPMDAGADAGGSPDYWLYPTRSDGAPILAAANAVGDVTNPGPGVANLDRGADWNGENGNVTTVGGAMASNAWGTFDMAGNLNEQTETLGTPIPPNPPAQPDPLPTRINRGGDFANPAVLAASPNGFTVDLNMQAEAANIGFRVAARFCLVPGDPANLLADRETADVLLSWDDPGQSVTWNVYRGTGPDPSTWGPAHASGVTDEEPGTPGIQYRDAGAVVAAPALYYRVTATNVCGESSRN